MKLLIGCLSLLVVALVFFSACKRRMATTASLPVYEPKDIYLGLRDRALGATAKELGLDVKDGEPFGVVVEIGLEQAAVTVAVFKTGDASLYFSNGGGQIGGIGHEEIRKAAVRLVSDALSQLPSMKLTKDFAVVRRGQVRVYALTPSGVFVDEAKESSVFNAHSPANVLFSSAQDVISGFRHLPPPSPNEGHALDRSAIVRLQHDRSRQFQSFRPL